MKFNEPKSTLRLSDRYTSLQLNAKKRKPVVQKQNRMDFFAYRRVFLLAKYSLQNSFEYILLDIKEMTENTSGDLKLFVEMY